MKRSVVVRIGCVLGLLGSLSACAVDESSRASELTARACPEAVHPDFRGDPRNAAGQVRFCWPGEALCYCDADRDCYALEGHVACVPPSPDAGALTPAWTLDAGRDAAADVPNDRGARGDSGTDARADVGRDVATDAAPPRDAAATPTASPAPAPAPTGGALRAFPGAEGFGAGATGGRGGRVIEVTNLNADGPGSLADALGQSGARTVVFRVSGVIHGSIWVRDGNVTLAGQSSPGGITLDGGLVCDNVYEPSYTCRNVIVRHMRFRNPSEDCVRLGGTERVILDHVSLENAGDESLEISRSHDITVQQTLIAEPVGEHFQWGGVLINYSKDLFPLDNITIHHSVWNGVHGRLPEISCEENSDGPGRSNCAGRTAHIELTNNVMYDVFDPVWYNRCTGTNQGNDCASSAGDFLVNVNFVGNVTVRRGVFGPMPVFADELSRARANSAFYSGNLTVSGSSRASASLSVPSRPARFAYPAVTTEDAGTLTASLQRTSGAFPRDPMDARILGYLASSVELRPWSWAGGVGTDRGDALRTAAAPYSPPLDSDHDGMPDDWERANGLNPAAPDANGAGLSTRFTGVSGYTNLECYLNALADERVRTGR